jgi:hypothetical protein
MIRGVMLAAFATALAALVVLLGSTSLDDPLGTEKRKPP